MLKKINTLRLEDVASICDHTFLKTPEYFKAKGCKNPIKKCEDSFYDFLDETINLPFMPYAICVRPTLIKLSKDYFNDKELKNVKIASVAGFPDGSRYSINYKTMEAVEAIRRGADEIDFVINYEKLKQGNTSYLDIELSAFEKVSFNHKILIKVILETSELTNEQIAQACAISERYQIDFVKTSTGYGSAGAKAEHLMIMRNNFAGGIKMSGGVNKENVYGLLNAVSERGDGKIDLDPMKFRIGESSLLKNFLSEKTSKSY